MKATVETFCPLFSGFYNTIWDGAFDQELDDDEVDLYEVDWQKLHEEIAKNFVHVMNEYLLKVVDSIEYQSLVSPKFYNFGNDSINVEIKLDTSKLQWYCAENKAELDEYLKENYTSRDGFISHYANSYEEWAEDTNYFTEFNQHTLGALLNFYCINEGIEEFDLYYQVMEGVSIYEFIN